MTTKAVDREVIYRAMARLSETDGPTLVTTTID